jgi:hypothetical protein
MAIISIPSSVGGITIPGITNVPGGPLGVLFGNPNQITKLQYPRDLGSPTKGHYIKFSINEITPANYNVSGAVQGVKSTAQSYSEGKVSLSEIGSQIAGKITEVASSLGDFAKQTLDGSVKESYDVLLEKRKKKTVSSIALYMPDTMNFQIEPQYGQTSLVNTLATAGSKIPFGMGGKVSMISNAATSDLGRLALATQGLALNPQNQLLFDGIDFRTFQLAFTFTPYSREEARIVAEIIKQFRMYASPQIKKGAAGMFFIPPGTFEMEFLYNGNTNGTISQVGESVITSIDVNYAPNGWSAHSDGAPVQTTLTMQFKELQLVDRTKISQGF